MKIFIDSADIKEIEAAAATGLIDGVTTNPSLVSKTGMKFEDILKRACELVKGSVSAEVTAMESQAMLEQAKPLIKIHENITIKLPLTNEGLKACKVLSSQGVKTNVTLCFQPVQALLAAKCGATFISPFVGRLDDLGLYGMGLIEDIKQIYSNFGYKTQILVASVRHPEHVTRAAKIGADVVTIPYTVFSKLLHHPLTDKGLDQFLKDWEKAKK